MNDFIFASKGRSRAIYKVRVQKSFYQTFLTLKTAVYIFEIIIFQTLSNNISIVHRFFSPFRFYRSGNIGIYRYYTRRKGHWILGSKTEIRQKFPFWTLCNPKLEVSNLTYFDLKWPHVTSHPILLENCSFCLNFRALSMTTTALVFTFSWISNTVAFSFSVKITIKVVSAFVIFRLNKFKLIIGKITLFLYLSF